MRDSLNRREVWLLKKEDVHFKLFRDALDARRKVLLGQGVGTTPKRADPVTKTYEEKLWETDTISTNTALGLSNGVYFHNCKQGCKSGPMKKSEIIQEIFLKI